MNSRTIVPKRRGAALWGLAALTAVLVSCADHEIVQELTKAPAKGPAAVTAARLAGANSEPGVWLSVGRTYAEQRFSPLARINTENVSRLGLAWFADFDTNRGQESTALAIDGALYVSTAWSKVKAFDARTGRLLWRSTSSLALRSPWPGE